MRASSLLPVTPLSVHIQRALLKPLPERCKELTQILRETSHKDLSTLFPHLVEHVYGFGHQCGWGLMTIPASNKTQDYECVFEFLAPDGPLLTMAYKLLGDGHTRYEFPVSCLPVSSQCLLKDGDIPLLYGNKVPYCGPGRPITHVLLNSFEYYIFHFAYSILNPNHSKASFSTFPDGITDSLFIRLLETYLSSFLPLSSAAAPSAVTQSHQSAFRTPSFTSLPASLSSFSGSPHQLAYLLVSSPSSRLSLGGILKRTPNSSLTSSSPGGTATVAVQEELWRSELLVLVLSEFWLEISPNVEASAFSTVFQGTFVPSFLHMQLVRLLVKHLHYFSNSVIRNEMPLDVSSAGQQSPWEAFKSQVIPQLVQKRLYTFLYLTFDRWPLDASFRLPLETWLSYIQPWRYVDPKTIDNKIKEKLSESIGLHWQIFVTENLLFYSVLFKKLFPRFFRMELNSPKNSFLLFRVAKVFSQTNLQAMITEAESLLQKTCLNQPPSTSHFLSPTAVNHLRQFVVETEGYNYQYMPMFGQEGRDTVSKLLRLVVSACERAAVHISELKKKEPGWFSSTFGSLFGQEECQGGLTLTESQRVYMHLNMVTDRLSHMFQLPLPQLENSHKSFSIQDSSSSSLDHSFKKWEFKEQLRPLNFRDVKYRGNPDLQPIRSFEVSFLVRMLNHLSTTLNMKYQNEINDLYMRPDWLGGFCRQYFMPPVTVKEQDRDLSLPPRLCLRNLAHKRQLMYFILFYVVLCLIGGYSFFTLLLVLTFSSVICSFVKVVVDIKRGV